MACVAINGYHSVVSYSWVFNGYICMGEDTPLLYTSREGQYSCKITHEELNVDILSSFSSQSKLNKSLCLAPPLP